MNPNTMQRALSALDQDGLTSHQPNKRALCHRRCDEDRRMSERYRTQDRKTIHQGLEELGYNKEDAVALIGKEEEE